MTKTYSNHHPYYHTQIIHVIISLGLKIFGDINKAVAMYSMFSIIVMSASFMYIISTIYECIKNIKVIIAIYMFYLLLPTHITYSITMWKDVFFGATVSCYAVSCYRYLKQIGNSKCNIFLIFLTSIGMCLLRSNGFVAFFVTLLAFIILFGKKQNKLLLLFIITLVSTFILKHPVLKMLNVLQPDSIEMFSIPAQQIACVIAGNKQLTEEQKQILSHVVDLEKVPETYNCYTSDPLKILVRKSQGLQEYYTMLVSDPIKLVGNENRNKDYIKEHPLDFLKVYLQLGIKYPVKYMEAWICATMGYWNGGYKNWQWHTYTDYTEDLEFGIRHTVKCPFFDNMFKNYLEFWRISPFLQLFFSIGFYVWGIVFVSYRALILKNKQILFIITPFLAVIFTLMIASPVWLEFRYAYAILCGFPFVVAVAFEKEKNDALNI